jgi:hypothetical protein
MAEYQFIQEFTRLRTDQRALALKEKPDGACIFLEGSNCIVHAVKPQHMNTSG